MLHQKIFPGFTKFQYISGISRNCEQPVSCSNTAGLQTCQMKQHLDCTTRPVTQPPLSMAKPWFSRGLAGTPRYCMIWHKCSNIAPQCNRLHIYRHKCSAFSENTWGYLCQIQLDTVSNKKAQLTPGLRANSAVIPRWRQFQDGRQPPSWLLSNRK